MKTLHRMSFIIFILLTITTLQAGPFYVITQEGTLNIRESPSSKARVTGNLKKGDQVTVLEKSTGENEEWSKIKTADGKAGFVSSAYLDEQSPEILEKSSLLMLLIENEGQFALKPMGSRILGRWQQAHPYTIEYLKRKKIEPVLLGPAGERGKFQIQKYIKAGCQEITIPAGLATGPASKLASKKITGSVIAAHGFDNPSQLTQQDLSPNDPIINKFKEEAFRELAKKGYRGRLQDMKTDNAFFVTSSKDRYYTLRFSVHSPLEGTAYEQFSVFMISRNGEKTIFISAEERNAEVGVYGGPFHPVAFMQEEGNASIIIIMYHIGFDSGMYQLYEIKDEKFTELNYGYGDAC